MRTEAYKALTHTLCSPIQGGEPIWDGTLPHVLPTVTIDTSQRECGAGWNACRKPEGALEIARLWPGGWPIRLFRVETDAEVIERGAKLRSATWTVTEELTINDAVLTLSKRWFGEQADVMAREQLSWHSALRRAHRSPARVERALATALRTRGLDWRLVRYDSAWDAWAAWAAWDARDAWAAWAALTVCFASMQGWIDHPKTLLTWGIRSAYHNGLAVALPTGRKELGWAMVEK